MKADGRDPQPHQVAKKMGISVNRYHEILQVSLMLLFLAKLC